MSLFVFMTADKSSVIKVRDAGLCQFPPLVFKVEVLTPKGYAVIVQVFNGNKTDVKNVTPVALVEFMNNPLVRCDKSVDCLGHLSDAQL